LPAFSSFLIMSYNAMPPNNVISDVVRLAMFTGGMIEAINVIKLNTIINRLASLPSTIPPIIFLPLTPLYPLIRAGDEYLTLEKYYTKSVGVYVLHIP